MSMKPDLSCVTIPIPISSSTLIGGLNKPSYHYIDAIGARKSLVTNKKVMGKAGRLPKWPQLIVIWVWNFSFRWKLLLSLFYQSVTMNKIETISIEAYTELSSTRFYK